ncbi:unnamed protein product [Peniophora sp. CBMAI 1063]|nr:unnamed protein product [Peniophora sp. CBMAI 1063]
MELSRTDFVGGSTPQPPEIRSPFIFSLPPELLGEIVAAVAATEVPRTPLADDETSTLAQNDLRRPRAIWTSISQGGTLGWLRLTHVCRGWRRIICEGMPLLWAQHIGCFRNADAVETMLRRAGDGVPLSVRSGRGGNTALDFPWITVQTPVPSWSKLECTIFRSRIRSLVVVDTRNGPGDEAEFESLASILPELVGLQELEVHCATTDDNRLRSKLPPCPDTCIISSRTLRSLRFTNHFISWNSLRITRLSIAFDFIGLPGDVIHDVLRSLPSIEELELDRVLLGYSLLTGLDQERAKYNLPSLNYLYIHDLDCFVLSLLRQVQLPDRAKVHLSFLCTESWGSTPLELAMQSVLSRIELVPSRSIVVAASFGKDGRDESAVVCNWAQLYFLEGASLIADDAVDRPYLTISVEDLTYARDPWGKLANVRENLGHNFPDVWKGVQSLDFDVPFWRCHYEIGQMLSCASHLRQVRIVDLFEGVERDHDPASDWPGSALFPSSLFRDPAPSLDLLWIVQTSDWRVNHLRQFCTAVAESLANAIDGSHLHHRHEDNTVAKRAVTLLRLDLIHHSGTPWNPDEEEYDWADTFDKLAERVEIRTGSVN